MDNVALQRWWLSLGSWITVGWLASHVIGAGMTAMFEVQVGFFPVWFFDCIACTGSAFSLPYGAPQPLLGVSIAGIVAGSAAIALLVGRHRPMDITAQILGVVLLSASGFHAAVTWAYRFPGSLPTIVVSVLIPALAAVAAAIGSFGATIRDPLPQTDTSMRDRLLTWSCLLSGMIAIMFLGGVASLGAGALCTWRATVTGRRYERILAFAGLALAAVGVIIRLRVRTRFPDSVGLL